MSHEVPTKESFLQDVKDHVLKILKDDDLYRHLRLKKPGTSNQYFDITTWPGYLVFSGDMGCYVFSRITDMFCFFRDDDGRINPQYWAEKVQAESVFGHGIREFSVEEFREHVLDRARSSLDLEEDAEIPEDMMDELRALLHAEDEYECVHELRDFSSKKVDLQDFWEHSCQRKTYYYIWACYAIQWAVGKYDEVHPFVPTPRSVE